MIHPCCWNILIHDWYLPKMLLRSKMLIRCKKTAYTWHNYYHKSKNDNTSSYIFTLPQFNSYILYCKRKYTMIRCIIVKLSFFPPDYDKYYATFIYLYFVLFCVCFTWVMQFVSVWEYETLYNMIVVGLLYLA